jgi:hypothetical protein
MHTLIIGSRRRRCIHTCVIDRLYMQLPRLLRACVRQILRRSGGDMNAKVDLIWITDISLLSDCVTINKLYAY